MKPIRTSESDPFTDEDRARLEVMGEGYGRFPYADDDVKSIYRALAHINNLEKALREIAERECEDWDGYPECARTNAQAVVDAYRNAASPTTPGRPEAVEEDAEVRMSGERDDLAARLEARADNADEMAAEVARNQSNYGESGPRHHARLLAAAYAFRKAAEMARASTHPEQSARVDQRMLAEFDAYPTDERWSPWTRWIDRHERTPWKLLQRADAALARASSAQSPSEGEACSDEQTLTKERNY